LFIPSNENHVRMFYSILEHLQGYNVLFLSQGKYKNEGAEKTLAELGIKFTKFDQYEKNNPEFVIKKENIGVVVIGNDSDVIPQWFINYSNKARIPTILIQDGVMVSIKTNDPSFLEHLRFRLQNFHPNLLALSARLTASKQYKKLTLGMGGCTQIHVWGKTSQSYFIDKGIDANSIVITGNPKLDGMKNVKQSKNLGEKIILYAPTDLVRCNIIEPETMDKLTTDLCSTVSSLENVKLIIKHHPREDSKFYIALPGRFGSKIEISDKEICSLMGLSDVVITDLSSVAIEALAAKKPVIIYLPNIEKFTDSNYFPNDLIRKNVFLYACDKKSLFEQIDKILHSDTSTLEMHMENAAKDYLGLADYKASLRSANNIIKLLNES